MYCYQCGTKLPQNAKFCFACGTQINIVDEEIIIENETENKSESKSAIQNENASERIVGPSVTIKILGNVIKFSDDIAGIKVVRSYFSDYAEKNVAKFTDYAKANIKCFDDIYENAIPFSTNCIRKAIENAVEIAKKLGITDMSYEWLCLLLEDKMDCESLYSYYYKIAAALEDNVAKLASYRGVQRANVPYWQGGGFGITGAIKGQLQASALNIGTNIIREIGDAITDSKDKESFKRVKENFYKNGRMVEDLEMILYNCSFWPYYALLPIFVEANIISDEPEREEAVEKAQRAFDAYYRRLDSRENCLEEVLQAIQSNPYESILYVYAEWISRDAEADIMDALRLFHLDYLYKYEKIAFERMRFEEIGCISDNIEEIQYKLRLLEEIEGFGTRTQEEVMKSRSKLRDAWGHAIQLMPEYDAEEMQLKIESYMQLKEEYGTRMDWFKDYQNDIDRLMEKYENKVRLPSLEMTAMDATAEKEKIADLVKNRKFGELWSEADAQNGYAQTILFKFYIARIGTLKGKINSVEQISSQCLLLNQKMQSGSLYAKFIYDVMVCQIKSRHNAATDKENAKRLHTEYLYVISEAAKANVAYAKFCLVTEIVYKDYWENYGCYQKMDKKLHEFSSDDIRIFIKDAANALIPEAVDRLGDLYKGKGRTYLCGIELNYENAEKLREIHKQLDTLDILAIMELTYEVQETKPDEPSNNSEIVCSRCGNLIKQGKKFCSQCGTKIM